MNPRALAVALIVTFALACRADSENGTAKPGDDGNSDVLDADGDTFTTVEGDCDDRDANVSPGGVERCDGVDNNCDGTVDEGVALAWFMDADADGFGDATAGIEACEPPGAAYVSDATDCDDARGDVYPGAAEACDDADNDCDGEVDEGVATTWYADADADGYGDLLTATTTCDDPGPGFVTDATDCDDTLASVFPEHPELCDEVDNDCNGQVDDGVTTTYFVDRDGDSYGGDDAPTQEACSAPTGYAVFSGDCDDGDASYHPGASELCSGKEDYNCDGSVGYADADLDGWAACEDCDDADADVSPDGVEVCNGFDDDCDGLTDGDDPDADLSTGGVWYADADGDGYGDAASAGVEACLSPAGHMMDATDCDDTDAAISPSAVEVCNGFDDDCDGLTDGDDPDADLSTGAVWYADADGDGYGDGTAGVASCLSPAGHVLDATDCDDTDAAISPSAVEVCNGFDDDCDGLTDDDDAGLDASSGSAWYADADGDGYGDASKYASACDAPSGYGSDATDCDDSNAAVNPYATEVCDGIDNDCNGAIDDDDAGVDLSTAAIWYVDADGDGFGSASLYATSCDAPSGYGSDATDCDDSNAAVNPGAAEACANAIDEDCDGLYSEGCASTFVSCGGSYAMDVGNSFSCDLGATVPVDTMYISVGCNDGETGSYTVTFDDGSSESVTGSCGSTHAITQRLTRTMTLYMSSGGGGDSHISFTCCGSSGWGMYYR